MPRVYAPVVAGLTAAASHAGGTRGPDTSLAHASAGDTSHAGGTGRPDTSHAHARASYADRLLPNGEDLLEVYATTSDAGPDISKGRELAAQELAPLFMETLL